MRVARLQGGLERLFVVSHHDITRRKLAEERAEHLALHDELTGLANRRLFGRFLGEEIRRGARNKSPVGVVAFDLDGFKEYNDMLGLTESPVLALPFSLEIPEKHEDKYFLHRLQ